jgi:hypothetical protein
MSAANMYQHIFSAARLAVKLESHRNPLASKEWAEGHRSIDCEQLGWAAAHIVDAKVLYGDVPKALTNQRLAALSPADLCDGYATLFAESLSHWLPGFPIPEPKVFAAQPTYHELHAVREASILAELARAAAVEGEGKVIVGVVGKAHVGGMQRMLDDGSWCAMPKVRSAGVPSSSQSQSQSTFHRRAAEDEMKLLAEWRTPRDINNRAVQRIGGIICPTGIWFPKLRFDRSGAKGAAGTCARLRLRLVCANSLAL